MRSMFAWKSLLAIPALLLVALVPMGCGSSSETETASHTEETEIPAGASGAMVRVTSGEEEIDAYLSRPAGEPVAVVVVIQEWWGLNDWVKGVADRFADRGYLAIAPDLYRGQVATDPEYAHELMRGLPQERAVQDIRSAAAYANTELGDASVSTGVVGFCMGGSLSLASSIEDGPFDATIICYGRPITDSAQLGTIPGPVLGIFGGADRGIGEEQVTAFESALAEAGKTHTVHTYDGAGHAFMNDTRESFDAEASGEAWKQIETFFEENLGS